MATPFVDRPPPVLEPSISRYDVGGHPTIQQVQWETRQRQFLINLIASLSVMPAKLDASLLPTSNPHVVGQVWSNAGILTVSAG